MLVKLLVAASGDRLGHTAVGLLSQESLVVESRESSSSRQEADTPVASDRESVAVGRRATPVKVFVIARTGVLRVRRNSSRLRTASRELALRRVRKQLATEDWSPHHREDRFSR